MALDVSKIIQQPLPDNCYLKEQLNKSQIYLHGTAGGSNASNVIEGWKLKANKIATAFVVAGKYYPNQGKTWKDGDIYQAFSSKYWAYHLGLDNGHFKPYGLPYKNLNASSIAIEITNWGYLVKDASGQFKNYLGGIVPSNEVVELPQEYRGYKYYQRITDAQIASVKELLIYLCNTYNIPKTFNANMFDVNKDALSGKPGIWTHTSVRGKNKYGNWDKLDCHPQPNLIEMLKSLDNPSVDAIV